MNCVCARRRHWEALFFVLLWEDSVTFRPLPPFIFCRCREEGALLRSLRRLVTGPKLPEEPHPWLQWGQWNQFSLVWWCIVKKGKIARVRASGRVAELDKSSPDEDRLFIPLCRNPVPFVLLCLTELTSWPQTFPSESPLFYPQRSCHIVPIPAPPSASPFPWKFLPGSLSISDLHVRRVVALGSKSGGEEREESEGVKSVSHDLCYISSKRSCVIM